MFIKNIRHSLVEKRKEKLVTVPMPNKSSALSITKGWGGSNTLRCQKIFFPFLLAWSTQRKKS